MLCTLYKGRRTETPCNKDDYFHRQLSAAKQISSHNVNFISTDTARKLHVFLDGVIIIRFRFSNVTVNNE